MNAYTDMTPPYGQPDYLPHNIDAEHAILGVLLFDNSAFQKHCQALLPEHFYDPVHERIYEAIAQGIRRGNLVDAVTLKVRFEKDEGLAEIGGVEYISFLLQNAPSGYAMPAYVGLVKELAQRRSLIRICGQHLDQAKDVELLDTNEVLKSLQDDISALSTQGGQSRFVTAVDAATELMDTDGPPLIPTGISSLDAMTGLERGGLTLIGGRASMGKSALASAIGHTVASNGFDVQFYMMEMSRRQLAARFLSMDLAQNGATIPYKDIYQKKGLSEMDVDRIRGAIPNLPSIYFDDTPRLTVTDIMARSLSRQSKPDLVIVDYLNIMSFADCVGDRHDQVMGYAAASLRDFAKRNNLAVILLCQLNRESEKRGDNVPKISDLRDSGELEQHADSIWLCYRYGYYLEREINAKKSAGRTVSNDDLAELHDVRDYFDVIIAKQRMGEIGTALLKGDMATNWIRGR